MSLTRNKLHHATVLVACLAGAPAFASPANVITGIRVDESETTRVVIEGSKEPTFTVFRLGTPPRVVVDITGADVSAVKVPTESRSKDAAVAMVTTMQFKDPSHPIGRVVVGLNRDLPFDVKAEGNAVVVTLQAPREAQKPAPAAQAPQAPAGTTLAAAPASPPTPALPEAIVVEGAPTDSHRATSASRPSARAAHHKAGTPGVATASTSGAAMRRTSAPPASKRKTRSAVGKA